MKKTIEINSSEYAVFKKYSEFEIPKIILLIPFFNIVIFYYISSSWFFNLANPMLYKKVRYRFFFPILFNSILGLLIPFSFVISLWISNSSITFYVYFFILTFMVFYLFYLNYFLIKKCKWSIWKFCLMNVSDKIRNAPLEQLPLDFYWENFLNNLTKRTFEEKNRYAWFFRPSSEENWKPIPEKIYCEAYNVYEIKDRTSFIYFFTDKRNFLFNLSLNLYYSLFVCAIKLCDQKIEAPKIKSGYFFSFLFSLINYLFINSFIVFTTNINFFEFTNLLYLVLAFLVYNLFFSFILRKILATKIFYKTKNHFITTA